MLLSDLCAHIVRPGDVVIDVGANVGQTAETLSPRLGPTGVCISFEPEPRAFAKLAALAGSREFSNVRPYCRVISNEIGHERLFVGAGAGVDQASTIVEGLASEDRLGPAVSAMTIESDTLDNFCAVHGLKPSLIKVDVEGAEDRVFEGARHTLSSSRPMLFFEFGYRIRSTDAAPGLFAILQECGYRLFLADVMFKSGKQAAVPGLQSSIAPVSSEQIVQHELGGDLLAVHTSRLRELSTINQVPFDSVIRGLVVHVPGVIERFALLAGRVETNTLNATASTYRWCRDGVVTFARAAVRLLRRA